MVTTGTAIDETMFRNFWKSASGAFDIDTIADESRILDVIPVNGGNSKSLLGAPHYLTPIRYAITDYRSRGDRTANAAPARHGPWQGEIRRQSSTTQKIYPENIPARRQIAQYLLKGLSHGAISHRHERYNCLNCGFLLRNVNIIIYCGSRDNNLL